MRIPMIVLTLAVITLGATYAGGRLMLSESRASAFLDEMEALSLHEGAAGYCDRVHRDARVTISDHSTTPPADFSGGREQLCAYVEYASRGLGLLGLETHATREEFTVTRDWMHPWTAHVSYHEVRITTMSKVHATLHTHSEDSLTLVQTVDGVKLLRLQSKVERAH